jgi:hypothetical protein
MINRAILKGSLYKLSVPDLVRNLPDSKRALLCELLIEIILESKKNELSNELVLSILAMWNSRQMITHKNTLGLIKTAFEVNPEETHVLLTKMGLTPPTGTLEIEALMDR